MIDIKTDFHLHTAGDKYDAIPHSERELIEHAARRGFKALAITNHDTFTYSNDLRIFAEDRGILLISGIERKVEGRHVLILNTTRAAERIKTFRDVQAARQDGAFIIAPHPFFKANTCLEEKLLEHLEIFDALEFSFFYSKIFNLNRRAAKLAKEAGLPMVGNSDCHVLKYFGICHSVIRVKKLTTEGVFAAIRGNNVQVQSAPIFLPALAAIYFDMKIQQLRVGMARRQTTPARHGQTVSLPRPTVQSGVSS